MVNCVELNMNLSCEENGDFKSVFTIFEKIICVFNEEKMIKIYHYQTQSHLCVFCSQLSSQQKCSLHTEAKAAAQPVQG